MKHLLKKVSPFNNNTEMPVSLFIIKKILAFCNCVGFCYKQKECKREMINSEWIRCSICGGKACNKIREDRMLVNYPLF